MVGADENAMGGDAPYNGMERDDLLAAVAGAGPELPRVLEVFGCADIAQSFPWFRLVGVAADRAGPAEDLGLRLQDVPLYPSMDALLAEHPGVALVFDLHEDRRAGRALREALPDGVSVVDARTAMLLWELLLSGSICAPVQATLFQARAFLATVLDGLEEDILILDRTGRVVDANRSVGTRMGCEKGEILGMHCRDIEGGDFCRRARSECPFQETLATGKKAEGIHTKLDEDGRLLYFRLYTYPIFDELGNLTHVAEMRRDITTRTYTEQRLQQAQKMAAIGELSTYIAHEIRNPLFAIGGFARSLLRSGGLSDEAREKVSIILEESRRLDDILRSILNYARPTQTQPGEVDVNQVVGETVQLMSLGCEPAGVCLDAQLDHKIPRAKGVADLLKQCLINMIKNSLEAMQGKPGKIAIRTGMGESMVYVQVRDEGAGIPDEVRIKVFNPFFSTKEKGSGLGLAMTRKIVEEAGGRVRLESEVGKGTTVTLLLQPLLAVDGDALDADAQGG